MPDHRLDAALAQSAFTVTRHGERVGDVFGVFGTLAPEGGADFLLFTPLAGADSRVDVGECEVVRRTDGGAPWTRSRRAWGTRRAGWAGRGGWWG